MQVHGQLIFYMSDWTFNPCPEVGPRTSTHPCSHQPRSIPLTYD
jgi:hypothetical protein